MRDEELDGPVLLLDLLRAGPVDAGGPCATGRLQWRARMRNPKELEKNEYNEFYKKTFNEFLDPLAHTHFTTEGEVEFRSVLYIPGMAPLNNEDIVNPKTKNIRLYVKRVFISDDFDGELFPRYLSFVKGVVDSNDLPLNVSREILQESRI
ncbi:hypothetical protein Taro_047499, partial [Colocasia esculenta]|nr:hypothetical protein [Colocasia esculenta]